jgi:hypothetical protein
MTVVNVTQKWRVEGVEAKIQLSQTLLRFCPLELSELVSTPSNPFFFLFLSEGSLFLFLFNPFQSIKYNKYIVYTT